MKNMSLLMIVLKLVIVIAILLTGINFFLKPEFFKSINLDYEHNDFCQTKSNRLFSM